VLRARFRALFVIVTALVAAHSTNLARADTLPTLDGRWSAGPLTVRWVIGDWGTACGPRPSGGGEAGTPVLIHQAGGELAIAGGGRTYSTSQCWEQYPGIQRTGHAASARSWKSSCRTAAGDPRQAALSTSLTATDNSISFYEAGQYQFIIEGQNCTASVGRYRTYTLVQRAGEPEPAPSATAASSATAAKEPKTVEPIANRCTTPGPAARLEVRPARKLIRAGEAFTFRAIVSDAAGCSVGARPLWAFDVGSENADLSPTGTVQVHPEAPEGELRLTASVGGRSALVTIEVASANRYDALLRSGAFNAAGEVDEAASVAIASQSIGAASAVAEDRARGRKQIFVGMVGAVALALAIFGGVLLRRSRVAARKHVADEVARRARRKAVPKAPAATPAPLDPAPAPAAPFKPTGTICPVCGTEYGPESRFCGKDGATLAPMN
jgi:hypothetical protein